MDHQQINSALCLLSPLIRCMTNEEGESSNTKALFPADDDLWELLVDRADNPMSKLRDSVYALYVSELPRIICSGHDPAAADQPLLVEGFWEEELSTEGLRAFFSRYPDPETAEKALMDIPVHLILGINVDADWEFTLNTTYPAYMGREYDSENKGMFDKSSVMWLTRRQGYKQAHLRQHLYALQGENDDMHDGDLVESKYLASVAREIQGEYTIFNQLAFLLDLPLQEALMMATMQKWGKAHGKWPGYVLLDKKSTCGFVCKWLGGCSSLRINLEKDVKIPLNNAEIYPDGVYGYPIPAHDVDWKRDCITHWGLSRQFRKAVSFDGDGIAGEVKRNNSLTKR